MARPDDFVYLDVNPAFETLTGLKNAVGKRVSELIPGIRETDRELLEVYGRVSLTGQPERLETYVAALSMWFSISVYSPKKEHFVAVFDVITDRKRAEEALRASEERHRTIIETAMDGFWQVDTEGRLLEVNETYCRMSGYSMQELLTMRISDLEASESADDTANRIHKIVAQGEARFESRHRRKDGTIFDVEVSAQNRPDQGGRLVTFLRDITARRQAERALQESEARLRDITFSMADWVWEVDANGVYTYSSEKGSDFFGPARDHIIGKTPFDLMPPDEAKRVAPIFSEIVANRAPIRDLENWNIQKNGERICLLTNGVPVVDEHGHLTGYRGVDKDITERKRAEEALRESERRVQKKLNSILSADSDLSELDLVDIIDTDAIQSMMDDFYRLTRVPVSIIDLEGKVLVGTGWQDICTKFHRVNPESLKNCIECDTVLSRDVAPGVFKSYLCKNSLWDNVTPLIVGGKHVGNLFTGQFFFEGQKPDDQVFRDQAARYGFNEAEYMATVDRVPIWNKEAIQAALIFYAKLANMISSLSHANLVLARMLEERKQKEDTIQASLREKEVLLREIHHRVKNNLQIIASLLTLQAQSVRDPVALEVLQDSQNRIRAMSLIHAKLYESTDLTRVDFGAFVRDLGTILLRAYALNPSAIHLKVSAGQADLDVDTLVPCSLIVNELLSNAVKHAFPAGASGTITVEFSQQDGAHTLQVFDNGVGFPADVDFRNTKSLGLRLVIMLVEQLDGTIEMINQGGTHFTIRFRRGAVT